MKRIIAILLMLCMIVGTSGLISCDSGSIETPTENDGQISEEQTDPEDILDADVTAAAGETSATEETTVNEKTTVNEETTVNGETTVTEESSAEETTSKETTSEEISSDTEVTSEGEKTTDEEKTTSEEVKSTEAESDEKNETLVWIPTNGGTKYHKTSTCSKMKDPKQVTIEEAIEKGFEPCGRCYK